MDIQTQMQDIGKRAKQAGRILAAATPSAKIEALLELARILDARRDDIFEANQLDLDNAAQAGMDGPRMDRLRLTDRVVDEMAEACRHIAGLPDPVGSIESMQQRPNGLLVGKMRVPLGVIAMIYESRPNVTIDSAILCLKAGNAVILRGGSEAINSNLCLAGCIQEALSFAGLPPECVEVVPVTDRAAVTALCKLDEYIDVIIPRGGENLIRAVVAEALMPVLKHYKGVCHVYVDRGAHLDEALEILFNAKVQRPGVCNAAECLLVHIHEAQLFLPMVAQTLGKAGVRFRCCQNSLLVMGANASPAQPEDFGQEFHDLILAVKVVANMDEALEHIARYGSNHTETICTRDHNKAMRFLREADASMVGVNCSTRFNDGCQLGLGAEIGISTSKLHSYGPMGVQELTTTKFVVLGQGQVRV
jgi:glutamate-5-semialdehyde dehydrogenase